MSVELSKVLDHIDKIRELDLEGVPPTSHVIDVVNALRADEPEPSLPREVIWRQLRSRSTTVRRPQPGRGVSELIDLTAAAAAERIRAREIDPAELFEAYRERAAADELNAFPWVADAPPAATRTPSSARWRAGGGQGPVLHRGRAEPVGLADPRGLPPAVHGDRGEEARRGGRPAARQDQPGRVRDGILERELGLRPRAQPVGPRARPGRLVGGSAAAVAAGLAPWRSAPTPAGRSASRRRFAGSSGSSRRTVRARATG